MSSPTLPGCRLLIGAVLAAGLAAVPSLSQAKSPTSAVRTVTVMAAHPSLPRSLPAGLLAVRLVADASTPYGVGFVRFKPGASFGQARKAEADLFKLSRFVTFLGGEIVPAGRTATVLVNAGVPGVYAMHVAGKEGDPGRVLTFAVTRPAVSVAAPAGSARTIRLTAHSVAGLPAHLRRGAATFAVTNATRGLRNMQIWRLDPGKTQRDFIAAFAGTHGQSDPTWLHAAGGMDVLSPGQTAWMTVPLAPGTYVADCPLPDGPGGRALALQGMITTFTVS